MALSLTLTARLLKEHGLLREIIVSGHYQLDVPSDPSSHKLFSTITYDTRQVTEHTLLICKGNFQPSYLSSIASVLTAYVSEKDYTPYTRGVGFIVNDVRKAMSILAAQFYDHPEDQLTLIGITGTKGKTTTAYFLHAILQQYSGNKTALFSSQANCVDGKTFQESELTTPESLDAFAMMRAAVDHGMRYLVMEVSSQAYKTQRVYGLTFDVGVMLNISPDHVSPIEHPSFEDYLYCKRQLIYHSRHLVLNEHCDYADLLMEDAHCARAGVTLFSLTHKDTSSAKNQGGPSSNCDVNSFSALTARTVQASSTVLSSHDCGTCTSDGKNAVSTLHGVITSKGTITIHCSRAHQSTTTIGPFHLAMPGDCNAENLLAAIGVATNLAIADDHQALGAAQQVVVPGRMEIIECPEHDMVAIVDFAHNFASVKALGEFVQQTYGNQPLPVNIIVVTGSAGNKALDRRAEIVEAAQEYASHIIFTTDDPDTESPADICTTMQQSITNPDVTSTVILDRKNAIAHAVHLASETQAMRHVLLIIGKGQEQWLKVGGKHQPYQGDHLIVRELFHAISQA